jgi:hypothetical protein
VDASLLMVVLLDLVPMGDVGVTHGGEYPCAERFRATLDPCHACAGTRISLKVAARADRSPAIPAEG